MCAKLSDDPKILYKPEVNFVTSLEDRCIEPRVGKKEFVPKNFTMTTKAAEENGFNLEDSYTIEIDGHRFMGVTPVLDKNGDYFFNLESASNVSR